MRSTAVATLIAAASLCPWLAGCGESSPQAIEVQRQLGATWEAMKTWGADKKADLLSGSESLLDDLESAIAKAKARASEAGADAADSLEGGWQDVQQKFATLKTASGEKWVEARDAFVRAYEALRTRVAAPSGR